MHVGCITFSAMELSVITTRHFVITLSDPPHMYSNTHRGTILHISAITNTQSSRHYHTYTSSAMLSHTYADTRTLSSKSCDRCDCLNPILHLHGAMERPYISCKCIYSIQVTFNVELFAFYLCIIIQNMSSVRVQRGIQNTHCHAAPPDINTNAFVSMHMYTSAVSQHAVLIPGHAA